MQTSRLCDSVSQKKPGIPGSLSLIASGPVGPAMAWTCSPCSQPQARASLPLDSFLSVLLPQDPVQGEGAPGGFPVGFLEEVGL